MFEVEVSGIEPFRNLVKAVGTVVEEGCFNVDGEMIRLLAMDPSRVAMVDFELPQEKLTYHLTPCIGAGDKR